MTINIKGAITISRLMGYESGIIIRIEDRISGLDFMEITISAKELGEALTGLAHRGCDVELWPIDNIGKYRRAQNVKVELPSESDQYRLIHDLDKSYDSWCIPDDNHRNILIDYAMDSYVKSGWSFNRDSFRNHHHLNGNICSTWVTKFVPMDSITEEEKEKIAERISYGY